MEVKDLFLTSEERYDVYCVKSSERPHLLPNYDDCHIDETNDDLNEEEKVLPLMDGCDIPKWRQEGLVRTTCFFDSALNVGLGCPLLRRESQLPLPMTITASTCVKNNENQVQSTTTSNELSHWVKLRDFLLQQPVTASVERIPCSLASEFLDTQDPNSNDDSEHDGSTNPNTTREPQPTLQRRRQFSKYEHANFPVIITDCCTEQNGWTNLEAWKFDALIRRFEHVQWRFSDTHGAMMALGTYAKYIATEGLLDDSPLAVYDSEFGDCESPMHELVHEYSVPKCFSEDLFASAIAQERYDNHHNVNNNNINDDAKRQSNDHYEEHKSTTSNSDDSDDNASSSSDSLLAHNNNNSNNNNWRPPWRWILMGPPRSGTGLHIDPLWTNAWVTLLQGTKRWILIPPHLTDQLPEGAGLRDPQVPSVIWFRDYYQQVIQLDGVVEILQHPGETVFVPNGWPHLVLNLEHTVAVTHNYASEFGPFERMWEQVVQDEPEFAQRWYRGLCQHRPDLVSRIHSSNKEGRSDEEEV